VTVRLTWSRPWDQVERMRVGALAETVADVRFLADCGALECLGELPSFISPVHTDIAVRVRAPAARPSDRGPESTVSPRPPVVAGPMTVAAVRGFSFSSTCTSKRRSAFSASSSATGPAAMTSVR